MLFIWRGDGAWVPVVAIGVGIAFEIAAVILFTADGSKAHTNLLIAAILAASAGVVYLIGRRVRGRLGPMKTDRRTGEITQYARKDEFFFVPLAYWPVILSVAAVVFVLVGAIRGGP